MSRINNESLSVSASIQEENSLKPGSIASRFMLLDAAREEVLRRCQRLAAVTIPSVFPWSEQSENEVLDTPYQGIGARTVNNLSNKLLLTLFPVSSPFFKLEVSEGILQKLQEEGAEGIKTQVESKLLEMENIIQSDMEVNAFRTTIFEALRSLVVTGNFLLYIPAEGEPVGYRLDQYVVKRSRRGKVLELILKEVLSEDELEPQWLEDLQKSDMPPAPNQTKYDTYTRVYLDGNVYREAKFINNTLLEGTEAIYPKEANAWIPLRWNALSGEDYGRSYVEEYYGDFRSIDGLSKALLEHSAITSKTFGIVRPNSQLTPETLSRVKNGGFVAGDAEDLVFPEVGKYRDMQVVRDTVSSITESVSRAFLLTQTRNAERVTAEEIRLQASELETALGGAYSLLAVTFQKPILLREISRLKKSKMIKDIKDTDIEPKVIVGLEGLGRGTDLDKFMRAVAAISQIAPSVQFMPDLDNTTVIQFVFNAVGLDRDEFFKSEAQKQAEAEQAQQMQAQQQAGDMMSKAIGSGTSEFIKQGVENPEATANLVQNTQDALQQQVPN